MYYRGRTVKYGYDELGNLLTLTYPGGEIVRYQYYKNGMSELEYDCRNRLVKAGDTVYEYDSEDNRTAQIQKGVRTEYLTDSTAELSRVLLAEESLDGKKGEGKQTLYVYGNGLISEESRERGLLYYHFNHMGSTMALTNQKGQEVRNYQYGPYGELLAGETEGIRFLFNGQYGVQTEGNGLYFLRARYYNTDSRRFVNRDILTGSIGETQSLNRYAYTQGDPVNQMDPFGLYPGGFGWKAAGHGALDLLGLIPVLGDVLDVVNSVWYFADGDAGQGASSLLSALPALGTAAGPAKKGVLKLSDKSVKGIQGMMKLTGNVDRLQ